MNNQLHYIYDPLCGWCYAAAPLIRAAASIPTLEIQLHGGGLWIDENRKALGKDLRDYVKPMDEHIRALTGQPFGDRYFNELLLNSNYVLDSEPLIKAILAVEQAKGDPLKMLQRIQQTHYRDGRWTGDRKIIAALAAEQNISEAEFSDAIKQMNVRDHINESRKLMAALQVSGYPSLALQQDDHWILISLNAFLGKVDDFKKHLEALMK